MGVREWCYLQFLLFNRALANVTPGQVDRRYGVCGPPKAQRGRPTVSRRQSTLKLLHWAVFF